MEIRDAVKQLQSIFVLSDKQLDFLDELCYVNKGTWNGDINELLIAEAKRDLALTLRTFAEATPDELTSQFTQNNDAEWLIQTIEKIK